MGIESKMRQDKLWSAEDSLEELAQLTETAGAEVVGKMIQSRRQPSRVTYLGKGKLMELADLRSEVDYDVVIFDDELTPLQQRRIEEALVVKVVDRTALILDIFAQRALTREGQLQVDLAQQQYLLPRLVGHWTHLERLGGGIGTRGPGETQLETDRRLIRERIRRLRKELEDVRRHRALYRRRRQEQGIPVVALVGYTNAGKSTLLNALGDADVMVEDKLFVTLDPTTRRIALPNRQELLLTDTVGFIQKLPTIVVAAFRATLEELDEADLLLHVVDISHVNAPQQIMTVTALLAELGLADKPRLLLLNKVDRLPGEMSNGMETGELLRDHAESLARQKMPGIPISALLGWGFDRLLQAITEKLTESMTSLTALVPYAEAGLAALFRQHGSVEEEDFRQNGILIRGKLPRRLLDQFQRFIVEAE